MSRNKEYDSFGVKLAHPPRRLDSVQSGHNNVNEKHVKPATVRSRDLDGAVAITRRQHGKPMGL
jgi:hypothetical protein